MYYGAKENILKQYSFAASHSPVSGNCIGQIQNRDLLSCFVIKATEPKRIFLFFERDPTRWPSVFGESQHDSICPLKKSGCEKRNVLKKGQVYLNLNFQVEYHWERMQTFRSLFLILSFFNYLILTQNTGFSKGVNWTPWNHIEYNSLYWDTNKNGHTATF